MSEVANGHNFWLWLLAYIVFASIECEFSTFTFCIICNLFTAAVVADNNNETTENTATSEEVVAATSEAAKAAVKAKDASVAARSKISAEALLSGDGELVTSVLSNCFSDEKNGIQRHDEIMHHDPEPADDEGESVHNDVVEMRDLTYAYIYLDGDVFIRLNLIPPYLGTVSVLETVPPPHIPPEGRGDMIDWAIFTIILVGTLFGFLVMIHQVGFVIDKWLRFRHFFPSDNGRE